MLPRLIARACESRIPRSGERGRKVNCYVVALDRDESPYFVATGFEGEAITGLMWDGSSYADEQTISLSELDNGTFNVTHYYGLSEVTYDSIYDVVWHHITKIVYLKIHLYHYIETAHQYFFNKRKLVTKKRMELIQFMMDDQLDRTHDGIDSLDLMTKLYSMKWFLHPSRVTQQKKLDIYLDSLITSGELRKVNDQYVVTGKAIATIEKYEEEERRHTEAVKLQKKMFWLTIFLVIIAIVQSGVIKLPTVVDFSAKGVKTNTHTNQIQPTAESGG